MGTDEQGLIATSCRLLLLLLLLWVEFNSVDGKVEFIEGHCYAAAAAATSQGLVQGPRRPRRRGQRTGRQGQRRDEDALEVVGQLNGPTII